MLEYNQRISQASDAVEQLQWSKCVPMVNMLCDVLYAVLWDLTEDENEQCAKDMLHTKGFCSYYMQRVLNAEEGEILDEEMDQASFHQLKQKAMSALLLDRKPT